MVHRVEELRQVKIYDPYVPLVRGCERFVNRALATPVGTKAMAVIAEYGFVFLAELLSYRLLDDTVCSCWDSQRSEFAFLLLWDHDSAYGLRDVFPRLHSLHYLAGMRSQVVR